jgi:hypothetical protein
MNEKTKSTIIAVTIALTTMLTVAAVAIITFDEISTTVTITMSDPADLSTIHWENVLLPGVIFALIILATYYTRRYHGCELWLKS